MRAQDMDPGPLNPGPKTQDLGTTTQEVGPGTQDPVPRTQGAKILDIRVYKSVSLLYLSCLMSKKSACCKSGTRTPGPGTRDP